MWKEKEDKNICKILMFYKPAGVIVLHISVEKGFFLFLTETCYSI